MSDPSGTGAPEFDGDKARGPFRRGSPPGTGSGKSRPPCPSCGQPLRLRLHLLDHCLAEWGEFAAPGDDPFDDRFHALERNGAPRRVPGHISWNEWVSGAWRQMVIIQGEGLEPSQMPSAQWNGDNHPGRLRLQSFRPHHGEPLTDALIGQGMMSLGGGGFGGGGLPYPGEVLQLWGGHISTHSLPRPAAPGVVSDDASGPHTYAIVAVGPQGRESTASPEARANGRARLRWDSVAGAGAYLILRDGKRLTGPLRIEGSVKEWTDKPGRP